MKTRNLLSALCEDLRLVNLQNGSISAFLCGCRQFAASRCSRPDRLPHNFRKVRAVDDDKTGMRRPVWAANSFRKIARAHIGL